MYLKRRPKWLDILGLRSTSERAVKCWRQALTTIFVVGLALTLYYSYSSQTLHSSGFHGASRRLLEESPADNTTSHGPEWERCDFELNHSKYSWLFNHFFFILVIFVALAIICDDFFVPSLEVISEKLKLSEDVAGATFMAAGSSAPELFSSVAGVAVESDVGIGTIVGSAVFNLLIIIALTAALAGQVLTLDWRPLARDSFFYAMSIGCFIGFAWDGLFTHYEAAIMLVLYALYIILMVFNPRLMDWMATWRCCCTKRVEPVEDGKDKTQETQLNGSTTKIKDEVDERKPTLSSMLSGLATPLPLLLSLTGGHARRIALLSHRNSSVGDLDGAGRMFVHHQRGSIAGALHTTTRKSHQSIHVQTPIIEEKHDDKEEEEEEEEDGNTLNICPCLPCCPLIRTSVPQAPKGDSSTALNWFKLVLKWILFIPAFPFVCVFSWTIPDCSKTHNKRLYIFSFVMSVTWIAALSFGMVTLVGRVGCILNIDSYVMGLVIVAIGTSVPDALSSVLVARDGYGDMAVSNAIGSNVFDINLGLGLPFIIRIAIDKGKPIELLDDSEIVDYATGFMPLIPHAKFGFILLIILMIALTIFFAARFRLTKGIGISFVFMYMLFLTYAFVQELYCRRTLELYC